MPIIIDGHNLIPKMNDIELSDLDDEMALIDVLQNYARIHRKKIEVYFDQRAPGYEGHHRYGLVNAFFTATNITADQAIINRLKNINDSAGNWTVVSSDRWIQKTASQIGAKVLSSNKFSKLLSKDKNDGTLDRTETDRLSTDQIEDWLDILFIKRMRLIVNFPSFLLIII